MRDFFGTIRDGLRIYGRNNCFNNSAAISFYALFSLIPIMILITAALGFIMGARAGLMEKVIGMIKQSLPYISDKIIGDLMGLSYEWKKMSWLGIISLILSAELLLGSTADALNGIFGTTGRYGFIRRKIINFIVLTIGVLAAFISIMMTAASVLLKEARVSFFGWDIFHYLIQSVIFKYVLPFLLVTFIVGLVYKIFSDSNMDLNHAFYGSLVFTSLWETAKHLFEWYILNFPSYNKFYGSIGALMALLLWMFYSSNIFLFSASIAKAAYDRGGIRRNKRGARRPVKY